MGIWLDAVRSENSLNTGGIDVPNTDVSCIQEKPETNPVAVVARMVGRCPLSQGS